MTGSAAAGAGVPGAPLAPGAGCVEPVAKLLAREDCHAHFAEILVAARMVAMHVRVDEELDGGVRDLLDRRHDLVGQRRELAVHHQHAIRTGEDPDRAALPVEDIEIGRELNGLDLNLAVVDGRLAHGIADQGQCGQSRKYRKSHCGLLHQD